MIVCHCHKLSDSTIRATLVALESPRAAFACLALGKQCKPCVEAFKLIAKDMPVMGGIDGDANRSETQ